MHIVFYLFFVFVSHVNAAEISQNALCDIAFECNAHKAYINFKEYPIICGKLTGENGDGKLDTKITPAVGPYLRRGTPMVNTKPVLCEACYIHVGAGSRSLGCIGISPEGFEAIKQCGGSDFFISRFTAFSEPEHRLAHRHRSAFARRHYTLLQHRRTYRHS
jgi:hypothetical protein